MRQNNCATQQMRRRISAQFWLIDACQMYITALLPAATTPSTSGTANVTARRRIHPNTTDATTDMYMPTAAIREAWCVSSARWAEASNPVIVYCDIRSPMPKTYQNMMLPKFVPEKPELFRVSVKTKPIDRCWSGTMMQTSTMMATPTMCQYAEIVLSIDVKRTLNRLMATASRNITTE